MQPIRRNGGHLGAWTLLRLSPPRMKRTATFPWPDPVGGERRSRRAMLLAFASAVLVTAFAPPTQLGAPRSVLVPRAPQPCLTAEVRGGLTPPFASCSLYSHAPRSAAHSLRAQKSPRRPLIPVVAGTAAAAAAVILLPGSAEAASIAAQAGSLADNAFVQASSLIFVSEIGDKTFFIAALLAARASRLLTFAGCAGALALMTAISVAIGQVFHSVPASLTRGLPIDDYVAVISFLYFGIKSLIDASAVEVEGEAIAEERAEAIETLETVDVTGGWPLVVEACTLTIAAEIGDRSQLATIALSAAANPIGVFLGGTAGHCLATGMAVLGGSFISKYLSERVIGIIGGVLFIAFALTTAIGLF